MAEQLVNLAQTTLAKALAVVAAGTSEVITMTTTTRFPTEGNFRINLGGGELGLVTAVEGVHWTTTRGVENTTPIAHPAGQTVTHVLTAGALAAAFDAHGSAASAQTSAEAAAASDVTTEATTRANADSTLASSITAEKTARETAVSAAITTAEAASDAAGTAAFGVAAEKARAEGAEAAKLASAENLKDLASAATARTNLGLGSAAAEPASAFDSKGAAAAAQSAAEAASIPTGQKGAASGVASLDSEQHLTASQVPPSVVSGSALGATAVQPGNAGGGATTATYGRTSTVAAPTLRDFVSVLDFVEPESGSGSTDDSRTIEAALKAVSAVGAGTLVITPHRLNGELAIWTVGTLPAGTGHSICVRIPSNVTVTAYGARFQAVAGQAHVLFGTGPSEEPFEGLTVENARWFGGRFLGTGNEPEHQNCMNWSRCADVAVRDVTVLKWGNKSEKGCAGIYFSDNQRSRVDSCTIRETSKRNGPNALQVTCTEAHGSNSFPYTEMLVTNCIVTGAGAAAICLNLLTGTQYANTTPVRAIVANNVAESVGWDGIAVEVGGKPAGEGVLHEIIISHNHARYTGPNELNCFAIQALVDSTPVEESPTVIQSITMIGNQCDSTRFGMGSMASNTVMQANVIKARERGIYCTGPGNASISHLKLMGNDVTVKEGRGIWLNRLVDSSTHDDIAYEEGGAGEVGALYIQNCTRVHVNTKITGALGMGVEVENGGSIYLQEGTRLYNPCTNATTLAGVEIKGTLTGPVWLTGIHIRDDRGAGATMVYGVDNKAAAGAKVYSLRNVYLGWTTAATHGTITMQVDDIIDESGAIVRGGKKERWGTAAPTEGTWEVGARCWNTNPSSNEISHWICKTAGTPGTWVAISATSELEWNAVEAVNAKLEAAEGFPAIQYAVDKNGMLHLRGAMKAKEEVTGSSSVFTIPTPGRPESKRAFTIYNSEGKYTTTQIATTGNVSVGQAIKVGVTIGFDTPGLPLKG